MVYAGYLAFNYNTSGRAGPEGRAIGFKSETRKARKELSVKKKYLDTEEAD